MCIDVHKPMPCLVWSYITQEMNTLSFATSYRFGPEVAGVCNLLLALETLWLFQRGMDK